MFPTLSNLLLRALLLLLLSSGPATAAETLAYYSDYFSFIGQDENGYLLFALDNNRGVDKGKYQAEHFGVLYDQYQGWVNLVGIGNYVSRTAELEKIPNSPAFQFTGHPTTGLRILSRANDLRLEINPITVQMTEDRVDLKQEWGNAAAVLYWQGRTVPGRVIYEGLNHQNWNRLTRSYSKTWDNFQGFYLAVRSGAPAAWQDIYLRSEGINAHYRTKGFIDAGSKQAIITAPSLLVTDKAWALGFYRWNKAWKMDLQQVQPGGAVLPPFARMNLRQINRANVSNWVIGGFAMSLIEGTLEVGGHEIAVIGFAELIK